MFKILDRRMFIWLLFTTFLVLLGFRLSQLTIIEGEELSAQALNTRLKKVSEIAKRGEIYDRNGTLLAGNLTSYTVQFLYDQKFDETQQKMAIDLFTLLEGDGEILIEMPIVYQDNRFVYKTDIDRENWLLENGFTVNTTAQEVFEYYRQKEQIDTDIDKYAAQKIMLNKGVFIPVRVKNMEFSYDYKRLRFLEDYSIDKNATATEAIQKLKERFYIEKDYDNKSLYYVILLRHAIAKKGYLKYEPIAVAKNISKKTAILIQEQSIKYANISVVVEPTRYYPLGQLSSHILGYMGKISSEKEIEKYNEETGYRPSDLVGKVGIEGAFEDQLKGKNGRHWIEVNASGRYMRDVANSINDARFKDSQSLAGSDIVLTVDMKLQAKVKDYLVRTLEALSTGGVYQSPYGDTKFKKAYPHANTGAVVVQDVRSGEILAMVSYPDYDLNLFANGITYEDFKKLQPKNTRNKLAPRPLYNIATRTAVQPGSTFKMITAFAALEAGLDPYAKYRGAGYIATRDNKSFGCWLWNRYHGSHGLLNLMKAIEVSCNYYFYSVGNGYDYARNVKMPFDVGSEKIVAAAKTFGLDEASGVEIGETVAGVPDPNRKMNNNLAILRRRLKEVAVDYFPVEIIDDETRLDEIIESILEVGKTNASISRSELFTFLNIECGIADRKKANALTDLIKYDYFSQFNWSEGDTFNLAIGQGQHSYTPVQMARYISTVANGGYLYDSTLVKTIDGEPVVRQPYKFIDPNGYLKYIRQGMRQVVVGSKGSVKSYFRGFPLEVAGKTGTAEKDGKIPPPNEEDYILKYLHLIAPSIDEISLQRATDEELKKRTKEVADLYRVIDTTENEQQKRNTAKEVNNLLARNYLDRGNAMVAALRTLSGNRLSYEQINQFKEDYDNFTWFVSFAPYEKPEIAVVVLIPQGGSGGYGAAIAKDIYGYYFNLPAVKAK